MTKSYVLLGALVQAENGLIFVAVVGPGESHLKGGTAGC